MKNIFLAFFLSASYVMAATIYPGGAGSSNALNGSFIAKNNGTGTNTTFQNTGSNTPAMTTVGIVNMGPNKEFFVGTNYGSGGEGEFMIVDAGKGTNNTAFKANGQAGFGVVSNGGNIISGFINTFGHAGDVNNNETAILADGGIHIKPAVNSSAFPTTMGKILLASPTAANRVTLGNSIGARFGESTALAFQTPASTTSLSGGQYAGPTPTFIAKTNGNGMATLYLYNPAIDWDASTTNWTGGFPQLLVDTNQTAVASSNFAVMGSFSFGVPGDGFGDIHWYNSSQFLQIGRARAIKVAIGDGSGNDVAGFGAGSGLSPDGNYISKYGFAIGRTGVALQAGLSSSGVASNMFECYGNSTTEGTNWSRNGFASLATDTAITIAATGWTNILNKDATVYVSATAVSWIIKNRANATIYTSPTLTATVSVHLQTGWSVSAASGLAGTALPE